MSNRRYGIRVAGFSSDGDIRLLNSMLHHTNLNSLEPNSPFCYMQDIIHIGTKLRNRLNAATIFLVLGNSLVSVSHLKILINTVSKEQHGLILRDCCPEDRQNFKSLEKVMQQRVTDALQKYVPGCEGTVMYIRICSEVISSLCAHDISPSQRVYNIWHANYFFRGWRKWLDQQNCYTLSRNFLSRNAYACIEINAHNLVKAINLFRDQNLPELFIPTLFNSQPCEETYRQMRSMGSMNYTKINFTLLELMHLIGRVELQNDIIHFKLADIDIVFPRKRLGEARLEHFPLPSENELKIQIQNAKDDALTDLEKFGILLTEVEVEKCRMEVREISTTGANNRSNENENEDEDDEYTPQFDFANGDNNSDDECLESGPFVEVATTGGKHKKIRKSHLVWLLTESNGALSKDRLRRVQNRNPIKISCRRRLDFNRSRSLQAAEIIRKDQIQIGDWCLFSLNACTEFNTSNSSKYVLGNIVSYKYIKGQNEKDKVYTWDFVPVTPELPNDKQRGIKVLASWFQIGLTPNLYPVQPNNSFYVDITEYVATFENFNLEKNEFRNDGTSVIMLTTSCFGEIEKYASDEQQ